MKRSLLVVGMVAMFALSYYPAHAGLSIWYIDGRIGLDSLRSGTPITIYIRWDGNEFPGCYTTGSTNGYRLYSPTGTLFTLDSAKWKPGIDWASMYDGGIFVNVFSGFGEDTIGFGGFRLNMQGIPDGFYDVAHVIYLTPFPESAIGGEFCIDTTWYPPSKPWLWSTTCGTRIPFWSGPHCYTIGPCCVGERGDVNVDGSLDVGDITRLVDYLFGGGEEPGCPLEADVNASSGTDVADLTYLVDYLFGGGPAPPDCP